MTDITLERILAQVSGLTPSQKLQVCDALLASATDTKKTDDVNAAAKSDKILAEAAATSPELYARIVAARGEARRIGVAVGADNRVDPIALDAALKASGRDPIGRMATKKLMALAGMID